MALFVAIILGLGALYDALYGPGNSIVGMGVAMVVAGSMTLVSYYRGDRVALWSAGARAVTKREAPLLYRTVENLAITAGLPTPAIYMIQDPAINAFATGRGPEHASVAVTSGALERLTNEELEGVIAHELSHIRNYDIRVMTLVVVLVGAITIVSDMLVRTRWMHSRNSQDRDQSGSFILVIGIILALLSPLFAQLIKLAISRRREFLADADGALLTRYPEGLARALEKIGAAHQTLLRPNTATAHLYIASPFGNTRQRFTALFSTHPPLADRIRLLRSMSV